MGLKISELIPVLLPAPGEERGELHHAAGVRVAGGGAPRAHRQHPRGDSLHAGQARTHASYNT